MDFLDHEHAGGNIYIHKLCFDLGSTRIRIRDIRSKARKKQTSQVSSKDVHDPEYERFLIREGTFDIYIKDQGRLCFPEIN